MDSGFRLHGQWGYRSKNLQVPSVAPSVAGSAIAGSAIPTAVTPTISTAASDTGAASSSNTPANITVKCTLTTECRR